jgi:DNA polymerase III subunit chi
LIDIGFYQLAERRAEAVLPPLVAKARGVGHRLLIRCADAALLGRIDDALWQMPPDSFQPHGIDSALGADRAATQPVLLSVDAPWSVNAADCLAQIGDDLPDDLAGLARVLFLFNADNLDIARARWRAFSGREGMRSVYWRETDGGRFEKAG